MSEADTNLIHTVCTQDKADSAKMLLQKNSEIKIWESQQDF